MRDGQYPTVKPGRNQLGRRSFLDKRKFAKNRRFRKFTVSEKSRFFGNIVSNWEAGHSHPSPRHTYVRSILLQLLSVRIVCICSLTEKCQFIVALSRMKFHTLSTKRMALQLRLELPLAIIRLMVLNER